jgi:micrococcal nuclease
VIVGGNDRFYPQVEQARDEAVAAGRGLHSPDVACTVPAQVRAVVAAVDTVTAADAQASAAKSGRDRCGGGHRSGSCVRVSAGLRRRPAGGGLDRSASDGARALTGVVAAGHKKAQQAETAARTPALAAREREAAARAEEERRQAEARERAAEERAGAPGGPGAHSSEGRGGSSGAGAPCRGAGRRAAVGGREGAGRPEEARHDGGGRRLRRSGRLHRSAVLRAGREDLAPVLSIGPVMP